MSLEPQNRAAPSRRVHGRRPDVVACLLAALAITAGCTGRSQADDPTATPSSPLPSASPTQGTPADTPTQTPPTTRDPGLSIVLKPVQKGKKVKLRVHATGYVYEPLADPGHKPIPYPKPARINILTTVDIRWGDGGTGGANAGRVSCGHPHVLRHVVSTGTFDKHTYHQPGTYRIRLTGYGCGLPKKGVTATASVTMK